MMGEEINICRSCGSVLPSEDMLFCCVECGEAWDEWDQRRQVLLVPPLPPLEERRARNRRPPS
jgi:hypothetical protein